MMRWGKLNCWRGFPVRTVSDNFLFPTADTFKSSLIIIKM